jgi:hypothetical protein
VKEIPLLSSPVLKQADSRSGSSAIAARGDSFIECEDQGIIGPAETRRFGRKLEFASAIKRAPAHPIGEAMTWAGPDARWTQRGNVDRTASPGEQVDQRQWWRR